MAKQAKELTTKKMLQQVMETLEKRRHELMDKAGELEEQARDLEVIWDSLDDVLETF